MAAQQVFQSVLVHRLLSRLCCGHYAIVLSYPVIDMDLEVPVLHGICSNRGFEIGHQDGLQPGGEGPVA